MLKCQGVFYLQALPASSLKEHFVVASQSELSHTSFFYLCFFPTKQ